MEIDHEIFFGNILSLEIDHEIFFTVILSLLLIQKGWLAVFSEIMHNTSELFRGLSLLSKSDVR